MYIHTTYCSDRQRSKGAKNIYYDASFCYSPVTQLDYCNSVYYIDSLSLNYPVSKFRTLLLVLSLKLLNHVISLLSYDLSAGSESLNASCTSSSQLPTKFSQPPNLHTFITSSLVVLALRLLLLLLGRQHHSDRSFRYASPCLWNQLPLSLRQPHSHTRSSYFRLTYSFIHHFFLFWFTTLLIRNPRSLSLSA